MCLSIRKIVCVLCFFLVAIFCCCAYASVDLLVFSPHPDDETLCCGGTIAQAVTQNKTVKIVYFTNGEAAYTPSSLAGAAAELGQRRQHEAIAAARELGLNTEGLVFLNYPDHQLKSIWEVYAPEVSTAPRFTRQSILSDLATLLRAQKPKRIYVPHPLDTHPDHQAVTNFVFLALDAVRFEPGNAWVTETDILYYDIHQPTNPSFFPLANHTVSIRPSLSQKLNALNQHDSQLDSLHAEGLYRRFTQDTEQFWRYSHMSVDEYLDDFEHEWQSIGEQFAREGYNVNLGVVADVTDHINAFDRRMLRRQRVYSQHPQDVASLVMAAIKGLNTAGVIPILKHFPGLGRSRDDPHQTLPMIEAVKEDLLSKDVIPYTQAIQSGQPFWIMIDHSIYSELDSQPATQSYAVATEFLRDELGFKGITITDELGAMRALKDHARHTNQTFKVEQSVVNAFVAGIDVALIYVFPREAKRVITRVIKAVRVAIKDGRLSEKDMDDSVARLLAEKERLFKKPLRGLLHTMSLQDKITQRLMLDAYTPAEVNLFRKYKLGGVEVRRPAFSTMLQKDMKIPMFLAGQHEGGNVREHELKLYSKSPYVAGYEFMTIQTKNNPDLSRYGFDPWQPSSTPDGQPDVASHDFSLISKRQRVQVRQHIASSLDTMIKLYARLTQTTSIPNPNLISPLTVLDDGRFVFKPYDQVPVVWLKQFLNARLGQFAYQEFLSAFYQWQEDNASVSDTQDIKGIDVITHRLKTLRATVKKRPVHITRVPIKKRRANCRILCLATHPDDEDGEALVYLKAKYGCETSILFATRGSGWYSQIGPELGRELGALRTKESERAAKILGVAHTYYLGAKDFGYTQSLEEVWDHWDREKLVKAMVRFYKKIKPDIIVSKNSDDDFHGQHKAFMALSQEAFEKIHTTSPGYLWKFYQRNSLDHKRFEDLPWGDTYIPPEEKECRFIAEKSIKQHRSQGTWKRDKNAFRWPIVYYLKKHALGHAGKSFLTPEELKIINERKHYEPKS